MVIIYNVSLLMPPSYREIHDKHPIVAYAMKTNLHQFEMKCKQGKLTTISSFFTGKLFFVAYVDDPSKPTPAPPRVNNHPSAPNDMQNKIVPSPHMSAAPMPPMPVAGMPMMPPPMPPMMGPRPGMPMVCMPGL